MKTVHGMRRRLGGAVGLALVLTCLFAVWPAQAGHEITQWKAAATPALKLPDLNGVAWSLEQHRGKVVLVNFWATWCEPCRAEMPSMQALADKFGPEKLVVVGVNYQENEMRIQRFLSNMPVLKFTILLDRDGETARAWTRRIFPTSVLVGPDGRARSVIVGEFDWAGADAEKMVRDLLRR